MKPTFVTKEQIEYITKTYPTPFHLYDEKGIRANAQKINMGNIIQIDDGNQFRRIGKLL